MSCSPGHMLEPLTLCGSPQRLIREVTPRISRDYLLSKAVQKELDISGLWHLFIYIFPDL